MNSAGTIPILLCIDVEPDDRRPHPERPVPWTGFEASIDYLEKYRLDLSDSSGYATSFAWFFRVDHQIAHIYGQSDWALHEYAEPISGLLESGDDLGLHCHAWRWNSEINDWMSDHGNQPWIEGVLADGFEKYARFFGSPCRSFRFGDHWMNAQTINFIRELGVRYELTVETGRLPRKVLVPGELATGILPDYRRAPSRPYRPSQGDYLKADPAADEDFWVIPLSTGISMPFSPVWYKRKIKRALFSCLPWVEKKSLNLGYVHPEAFRETVESYFKRSNFPHLILAVRTDAFQDARQFERMDRNLRYLLNHKLASGFRFVRPDQFVEMYQTGTCTARDLVLQA